MPEHGNDHSRTIGAAPPAASMAGALLEPGARRLPGATWQHRDRDLCLPIGAIRTGATPKPSTPHRCHT
jgi:hypothetical protein